MRRAEVEISIKGKDVTRDLQPYLLSLDYTDKSDDELDDLQLSLEDREGLFQGDWMPRPGDIIAAKIRTFNWHGFGDSGEIDCGEFECDEIELENGTDGDRIAIKAVPAVVKSSLMNQRKTRAWGDCPMAQVIAHIAGEAGLDTLYKAPEIVFERVEQRQESDLAFMQRICKEQGLRLAVKKSRVIVYMGQTADATDPLEYKREEADASGFRFRKTMNGIYTECRVGYTDADASDTTDKSFQPEEPPSTGKVLTINKRIEHPAQAERVARAELRDKNSQEITGSFDGMGDTRLVAGCILDLKGWGQFDSTYVIRQAKHTVDFTGGYRTSVELEKALEY